MTGKENERLSFATAEAWAAWLKANHGSSPGVWLQIAKKGSAEKSVTYGEAVDVALAWGWIDGQKQKHDESAWLQRFTPRTARSPWSKINRDKAMALVAAGKMAAPGLAEGAQGIAAIRPQAILPRPSGMCVPGRLLAKRFLGEVELLEIAVDGLDAPLKARVRSAETFHPGRDLGVDIAAAEVLVFAVPDA